MPVNPINISTLPDDSLGALTAVSAENIAKISLPDFILTIKPLILFAAGITLYAIIVFKFYKFLAKKDILNLELHKYSAGFTGTVKYAAKAVLNLVQNIVLIPLFVFFWFAVLALILVMLSKNHTPNTILLTSAAVVGAVRIAAHYNEELSIDLAKLIPLALLGVFLIDISYFSIDNVISTARQIPMLWRQLIYYLVFVAALELVLRIMRWLYNIIIKPKVAP